MVLGEFHSMTAIHEASPNFAPKPLGWGSYAKEPDMYFFLCAFHEMKDKVPDVSTFPAMLAQLHKNGVSPSGKFGFPVPTYQGRLPQDTTECDTWEESFTRGIRRSWNPTTTRRQLNTSTRSSTIEMPCTACKRYNAIFSAELRSS
jgi:protein-ribulosamine 3-kinase